MTFSKTLVLFDFLWIILIMIVLRMYNFVSLSLFLLLLMVITTWPTFNNLLFRQKQASFSKSWTIIFQDFEKKEIYSAFWLLWDFSAIFIDFRSIWSWYLIWNLYHKNTKLHISIEHDLDTFFDFGIYHQFFFSHFQQLIFFFFFR